MAGVQGRVAVVTGGARGIGAAIARRLVAGGAAVALLDLDETAVSEAAAALDGRAIGLVCDVTDADAVHKAVTRVSDELGGLHILVNNAGVTRDNLIFRLTEGDWDTVIGVHLKGAFLMTRAAQSVMVPAGYGRVVNLSSTSALGNRGQANYSTAKMGLQGFTRTLAIELGQFGITANAVAPGFIVSAMTDAMAPRMGITTQQLHEDVAAATPVRRVGQVDDIARAVEFLAAEESSFITGQTLYVDGGARL
jgi:3-oxoacyl-[acyl-carrier protein] reductase